MHRFAGASLNVRSQRFWKFYGLSIFHCFEGLEDTSYIFCIRLHSRAKSCTSSDIWPIGKREASVISLVNSSDTDITELFLKLDVEAARNNNLSSSPVIGAVIEAFSKKRRAIFPSFVLPYPCFGWSTKSPNYWRKPFSLVKF